MTEVTIVICTRNRARQLENTLRALAELRSTRSWEVIAVDNNSTDDTAATIDRAAASDPRLRRLFVARTGLGAGRDAAWREAKGRIVAFTDDDCLPEPNYVDMLCQAFEDYPECGCIGGRIELFDPNAARVAIEDSPVPRSYLPRTFVKAASLHGANLAFLRVALERSGGFDPEFGAGTPYPAEDVDAMAGVLWAGYAGRYDPRPVVYHDHGRTVAQALKLYEKYDFGRGAYYMKYLLRADSRAAYVGGWFQQIMGFEYWPHVKRFGREVKGAASYLAFKKRYGLLLALLVPGAAAFAVFSSVILFKRLLKAFAAEPQSAAERA